MKIASYLITAILTFYALAGFIPTLVLWIRYYLEQGESGSAVLRFATGFAVVALLLGTVALSADATQFSPALNLADGFSGIETALCRSLAQPFYQLLCSICQVSSALA